MPSMGTLVWLVCIVAAFALIYWYLTTLTLPPVVKNLIIVVCGLIAIVFIYNLFAGGGHHIISTG
jgi:presenilin-like A22 family membrane protease